MMFKIRAEHEDLCIIRLSADVLDEKNVLITDGNASSEYVRFFESPGGIAQLDSEDVFREDWRHGNTYEYWRRKRCVCAEVLVPTSVPPKFIVGIYVSCSDARNKVVGLLAKNSFSTKVSINADLFFQ